MRFSSTGFDAATATAKPSRFQRASWPRKSRRASSSAWSLSRASRLSDGRLRWCSRLSVSQTVSEAGSENIALASSISAIPNAAAHLERRGARASAPPDENALNSSSSAAGSTKAMCAVGSR